MSRIPQAVPARRRGRAKVSHSQQTPPRSSQRSAPATGLSLLGTGCGESLPDLGGLPATYQIGTNGELLYRLCVALMERKLIDESLWLEAGKIPVVFARNAILKMIEQRAGDHFKDNMQYECVVSDTLSSGYYSGAKVENEKLVAIFDLTTAGFVIIGEAIRSLDEQEQFLGAALYVLLTRTLRRRLRLYDHVAATWYNEQLHDLMEDDDPDNRDQYEFPKVEDCIPPSVKTVEGWPDGQIRRLLRRHLKGPHGTWIEKVLLIERLTRLPDGTVRFEQEYDDLPVPSVLIVFRDNDAIHACWDAESAHYNEASNEPACTVEFRPDDPKEFDAALRSMWIFLRFNIELAQLINLVNEWEENHASERQHRAEPALRAA
jgi:hypothetical protein